MPRKRKENNPIHYKEDLPRVSTICETIYPFEWTPAEKHFLKWLEDKWVNRDEYMEEASKGGRYIHEQLENYLKWLEIDESKPEYFDIIISWQSAIDELDIKPIHIEHYICNDKYQWTIDLVARVNWKKTIVDWKTYWLAKYKWWLDTWYKKPTDKLKKATLQLSLYAKEMWIKDILVIELDKENYYPHYLKRMSDEEIDKIINKYYDSILKKPQVQCKEDSNWLTQV